MSRSTNTTCYENIPDRGVDDILFATGVIYVVEGALFLLSLFSVLIFLRRKAFNNPAKRFGLSLIVAISVLCLDTGVITLYPARSLPQWLCVVAMLLFCSGTTILLYLVALPTALLLQVSAPIIPESVRHKVTHMVLLMEFFLHPTVIIVSVLLNIPPLIFGYGKYSAFCEKCVSVFYTFDTSALFLCLSVVTLCIAILMLALTYCKYRSVIVLTRNTKLVMFKVFFLLLITYGAFIGDVIFAVSVENTFVMRITQSIFFFATKLMYLPVLIVLMYFPNTICIRNCFCQQCARREREPLIQQSEEAPTNPDSVWDHTNAPSYTSYHPQEMSDCI